MAADLRLRILELQRSISASLAKARDARGTDRLAEVFNVISLFDQLTSKLYQARALKPPHPALTRQAEDIVAGVSIEVLQLQRQEKAVSPYAQFVNRYRQLWRENLSLFVFTAFIFIGTCFLGWELALTSPSYVSVIIPQRLMEDIIEKHAWFHDLRRGPLMGGLQIAFNNINVGIASFVAGGIVGLGGLYYLIFNGVMFGALMGFCYTHHFNTALTDFVVGHGVLELTIIVASTFAGFVFGRAFYMRPVKLFRMRMARAASDAGFLIIGVLPWLCLAASIEAFVSPWPTIPFKMKFMLGLLCGALFWAWTFAESPDIRRTKTGATPNTNVR